VLFVSPSGSLVESNRVYPYGEKWMADYGTSNDQKFTTYTRQDDHYTDEVDYAMTRYYFYSHGAFMSPDPLLGHAIDPQTWNRYSYGLDDPINFVDPSGLCWTIDNQYIDDYDTGPCYTVTVTTPRPSQTTIDWFFESLWSSWGYQGQPTPTEQPTAKLDPPLPPGVREAFAKVYQNTWPLAEPFCSGGAFVFTGGGLKIPTTNIKVGEAYFLPY